MEPELAQVDLDDVNLEIAAEAAGSQSKNAAPVSPVEERKPARMLRATLVLVPAILALVAIARLTVLYRGGAASDMQGKAPAALTGKHASVATEIYIVDDRDAKNDGQNAMLAAVAGEAPYFHKWFGDHKSKAFHHDGGDPTASKIAVTGTYEPSLQTDGCYEVHEWHPSGPWSQMSMSASVEVTHTHGVARMLVDQGSQGGQWNYLASFHFKKGAAQVALSNRGSRCVGAKPCYTSFDAFRFIYTAPACDSHAKISKENTFVFGSILLSVSNAAAFIADPKVTPALTSALATLAGASSDAVSISISAGKRRLSSSPQLAASVIVSYRIKTPSGGQPSDFADALDAKTTADVANAIEKALLSAGSALTVLVTDMRTTPDSADAVEDTPVSSSEVAAADAKEPASKPTCMPATIINDFDSHLVTSIVSPEAHDLPQRGLDAFRPGRVGEKPFFHDWFGDIFKKDFHHDAHMNKGLVQVNYTSPLAEAGCYLVQEWHLGGNKYCVNYMPRRVPFHVHDARGAQTTYTDQSTNGGQWNTLGLFQFSTSATIVMSNAGTNDCQYRNSCYTVFDSLRLVHVGGKCDDVDHGEDSLVRMSDLACDSSNSLAQLRHAPGQNEAEPSTAESSSVKLLGIMAPHEKTVVAPEENIKVSWQTEGVASGTDVKISLLYDDEVLAATKHRMSSASGEMQFPVPSARFIKSYSNVVAHGSSRFRVRIDVQHVKVELSNGWSNQLYAYSPYFTIKV